MVNTNWYVITGAPSSGKTTLINELDRLGYRVTHEVAREYICNLLKTKPSIQEIRQDIYRMQSEILTLKLVRERQLAVKDTIFFDRGLPDSIAYYQYHHLDPSPAIQASQHFRYKKVFFLARLPLINDGVRIEDEKMADELGRLIYQAYLALNYEVIFIPPVSVAQRLELILDELRKENELNL